MEALTRKEEKVMQILWKLKKGFIKDIIEQLPNPKPPYNTISSVVRILEKKGFVYYEAFGKTHQYYPKISKLGYKKYAFKKLLKNYFGGSYENVVSYMINEEEISPEQAKEISNILKKGNNNK